MKTMCTKDEVIENRSSDNASPARGMVSNQCAGADAPSGFILKLYQMVHGAPDEVISWTSSGDAFMIGSDLKRLESETLPKYFRHNRFQSLVRQLNFYSFRKINRERNVWVYKHHLFHRDRPDDLYLVRRRTCPGLDGRKQRFSRGHARRTTNSESEDKSDEESLYDVASIDGNVEDSSAKAVESDIVHTVASETQKRQRVANSKCENKPSLAKRQRASASKTQARVATIKSEEMTEQPECLDLKVEEEKKKEDEPAIDMSLLLAIQEPVKTESEPAPKDAVTLTDNVSCDRVDVIEQSMVVSEVAMKLDEYARKALKGRGASASRGLRSGVVTPPYNSSRHYFTSSSSLFTYDDEEGGYESEGIMSGPHSPPRTNLPVAVNDDRSEESWFASWALSKSQSKGGPPTIPPISDQKTVEVVLYRMLGGRLGRVHPSIVVPATVARFCMSTAPSGDKVLCSKVLHLIASCDKLAAEFHTYRGALNPSVQAGPFSSFASPRAKLIHATTIQQIWEHEASRYDAIRDFKVFAVNCINFILDNRDSLEYMTQDDFAHLERTAGAWLDSVALST